MSTTAMAAGVIALLVVAGGASYFVGLSNAGTTTSTATSTITQTAAPVISTINAINYQTITQSITQTSTSTTTISPVNFAFVPQPKTGEASNLTRLFNTPLQSGAKVRFLNFTTTDSMTLSGGLVEPQNSNPATTPAILAVHGRGSNYTHFMKLWASRLTSYGYSFLAINTRGHDGNLLKDNFDYTYNDLGAGFAILKSLGYSNIIVFGYSFGGMQVPAFAAATRDPALKAVVLGDAVSNLAWKCQYTAATVIKDPTLYSRLYTDAKNLIAQGQPYAILPETVPQQLNGQRANMSAINFLTNWSPEATPTTSFIRHVNVPIFIGRVASDTTVPDFEAQWLLNNATASGSQVPSAKYVIVPDPSGKAGHTLTVVSVQLAYADTIHAWLQGQKIGP